MCWKSLTATCAVIRPPLTAFLYKSQQSHCRLFTSQACDEAASHTLAQSPAEASHSNNTHTIHLPPSKFLLLSQKNDIWEIKLFEGGRLCQQCSSLTVAAISKLQVHTAVTLLAFIWHTCIQLWLILWNAIWGKQVEACIGLITPNLMYHIYVDFTSLICPQHWQPTSGPMWTMTVLAPFEELNRKVRLSTASTAEVFPAVTVFKHVQAKEGEAGSGMKTMKTTLLQAVNNHFSTVEDEALYTLDTLLDPWYNDRLDCKPIIESFSLSP